MMKYSKCKKCSSESALYDEIFKMQQKYMYLDCQIKNKSKISKEKLYVRGLLQDRERNYCARENVLTIKSAGISRVRQKGTLFYRKVWGSGMKD